MYAFTLPEKLQNQLKKEADERKEEEEDEEKEDEEDAPDSLKGMVFAITGALSMKRDDVVKIIKKSRWNLLCHCFKQSHTSNCSRS